MTNQSSKDKARISGNLSDRPAKVSRRALLRSGVTIMPAILTLQSGAAFARTSNLVSASSPDAKVDGHTMCLDTNSVRPVGDSGNIYDLDEPPLAKFNVITEHNHLTAKGSGDPISEGAMCERGGTYWYNDKHGSGWQTVELPTKGIVVSSGAWTSIAEHSIQEFM